MKEQTWPLATADWLSNLEAAKAQTAVWPWTGPLSPCNMVHRIKRVHVCEVTKYTVVLRDQDSFLLTTPSNTSTSLCSLRCYTIKI